VPASRWYLNPLAWFPMLAVRAYQKCIPARYKPECRFIPTCSQYAILAIQKYGAIDGIRLGWSRFHRCVGFAPKGVDWP
jgi:uncharacterized protein